MVSVADGRRSLADELKTNRNETVTKLSQNSFESVLKLFCFSLFKLANSFKWDLKPHLFAGH